MLLMLLRDDHEGRWEPVCLEICGDPSDEKKFYITDDEDWMESWLEEMQMLYPQETYKIYKLTPFD